MITTYDIKNWYWKVGDKPGQVFSTAAQAYVADTDATYQAWVADGGSASGYDTDANLITYLRERNVPPYHHVSTGTIISRIVAAGILSAWQAQLAGNADEQAIFQTASNIYFDDATVRGLITAAGGDPDTILAAE